MNDKIRGFVLTISDYKDADVLMQVACKDVGILSLVGKASKKLNSKNHFLPMCEYEFIIDYKDGKTIYSVHGYKVLNSYFDSDDIILMSYKNILTELAIKNKEIDLYEKLIFVFSKLNNENKYLLGSLYLSYIVKQFGITPIVDECAVCGNKKIVSLSNTSGGFLCEKHSNGNCLPVEMLKKFRLIIKADFVNYDAIKDFKYSFSDFCLLMDFYIENTDIKLKAYDFYKSLV